MKKSNVYIDVHAIQTVPPSNLNRDDTGSPKTAQYGGVTRSRVSSQSWKKAIRTYFNENGTLQNVGIRSLEIVRYLADKIVELDSSLDYDKALGMSNETLKKAGVSTKDNKVKALFFLGESQAAELAKAAVNDIKDKKILQEILRANPAVDIALFGRMVADDPSLNEDASSQVGHAISTHAVQTEFDFFTATDDLSAEDNAGAGMLGTIEFNSSTLYRYANVAAHELLHQLGDKEAVVNALKLFVEAFANSMPTGKVNTFANQTVPQALVVVVRQDRPISLVSAFETPVKSSNGYVKESIDRLKNEFEKVQRFVDRPVFVLSIGADELGEAQENLNKLLSIFEERVTPLLETE